MFIHLAYGASLLNFLENFLVLGCNDPYGIQAGSLTLADEALLSSVVFCVHGTHQFVISCLHFAKFMLTKQQVTILFLMVIFLNKTST